ncbi:MAG TPA: ATP-binding protein [Allosphingosinicella sp.]|nr:ATP-binding protein [Allosphingosinicella sp.]
MGSKTRKFQSRARVIDDDGTDFEQFVFETFRIAKEEAGFSKRLARGRDGAIDLLDRFTGPGATVAECKYIGSGDAEEATRRWQDIANKLKKYLPKLHCQPKLAPKSPYRGWINPSRPILRYRFCVTATMLPQEIIGLEQQIAKDFQDIVNQGVKPLADLAANLDGAVRVLSWDWFHQELNEHPVLAYRWFGGLPRGLELLGDEARVAASFRDFLTGGALRYFSRDQYASERAGQLDRGESALVSGLARGEPTALLITGPGGVGKTRLSLELARSLAREHGFGVYRITRSVNFNSVSELAGSYDHPAPILMLADYAEAVPALSDVAEAVAQLRAHHGHRIRLVATCRASATNQVMDNLAPLDPEQKSLSASRSGEGDYVRWVTHSILALEDFPHKEELEHVCHGVPALAAFALFLFRYHPKQFNAQFGALHGLQDFEKWVNHRISILVQRIGGGSVTERLLARIALALPLPLDQLPRLAVDNSLIDALLVDRWIERQDDHYGAVHDVFADALTARWLFEADHAATDRAIDLLIQAAVERDLIYALTALARLASHPKFPEIDGAAVANELLLHHPKQAIESLHLLLSGLLLKLEEKLDLLHRWPEIQDACRQDTTLAVPLSILADEAARRTGSGSFVPNLATLTDLLDHICNADQPSNMILRRAYALDPARFRARALSNIAEFSRSEPTHFLLVAMLRLGEPTSQLETHIRTWLESNATVSRASFLYWAWLNAKGSLDTVEAPLLAWVAEHGNTPEARFVYGAWLDAHGSLETVEEPMLAWLAEHGSTVEASRAYQAWLQAHAPLGAVEELLLAWVAEHGNMLEARFVYEAWLNAKLPLNALEAAVLGWIAEHGDMFEASHIYEAWLDAQAPLDKVEVPVRAWVAEHGSARQAQFVYRAWLDAKGRLEAVAEPLYDWVAEHGSERQAQFVYRAWLDAKGPPEAVEGPLLAWLAEYGSSTEAIRIYRAWVKAQAPWEAVEAPLLAWMAEHGNTLEASYAYEAWLNAKGSLDAVEELLFAWLSEHGTALEAQFVYNAWLDRNESIKAVENPLLAWVAVHTTTPDASHVYKAWCDRGGPMEAVETAVLAWVAQQGTTRDASHVYRAWLNRGADFESIREQICAWVVLWHREPDTAFVTRHLCKRHDLPESVILAIARWSVAFTGHEDGLDRLGTLLAHVHDETLSQGGFLQLIALAEDAIVASLAQEHITPGDRSRLWAISASLARRPLFEVNPYGCVRSIARIIKSGKIFTRELDASGKEFLLRTYDMILNAVLICLRWGELSGEQDSEALSAFVEWIDTADPPVERSHRLLKQLKAHPLHAAAKHAS